MAELTRRRRGEYIQNIFEILMVNPDGLPAMIVLDMLSRKINLTTFEKSTFPKQPNVRRFEKGVRFTTISSVKAGWLVKDKGQWTITEEGKKAYEKFRDPETLAGEAERLYRQWRRSQPEEEPEVESESAGATTTLEEAEESAWVEIQEHLSRISPQDFQNLVAALLRGMGYHVSWVAPPGPDKGIDIIAYNDPLGIQGARIKVQVKRRSDKVTGDGVRAFLATLGDGDAGIFVSMGGFTSDAESTARGQEKRRIMLVDLKRLFDLWVEHYEKIPKVQRRLLPLRAVYFFSPSD
ncbi:MAG: restriction endonuclease [Nitrospirae bacterium]|nr:restriction endonuclease [Candidatus Manganitrophaceae bacterium]